MHHRSIQNGGPAASKRLRRSARSTARTPPGSNARAAVLATTVCREMVLAWLQRRAQIQASVAGGVPAVASCPRTAHALGFVHPTQHLKRLGIRSSQANPRGGELVPGTDRQWEPRGSQNKTPPVN